MGKAVFIKYLLISFVLIEIAGMVTSVLGSTILSGAFPASRICHPIHDLVRDHRGTYYGLVVVRDEKTENRKRETEDVNRSSSVFSFYFY